jgi:chromosome segregation protein
LGLEADLARQRHLEADIEAQRARFGEASDHFNRVQGRYYAVGAEIARLEQGIQFARENRRRQEVELARLERESVDAARLLERDQAA